ncbi:MAG: SDR family NAD(P)-dependent oxidoreductase [Bacillota bacterium]
MKVPEMFNMSGKVALITGGSRGLGFYMATGLVECGMKEIVICARRQPWLGDAKRALEEAGARVLAFECDVRDQAGMQTMVSKTIDEFGKIDILINNAGQAWAEPPEAHNLEKFKQVCDVNINGTFICSQEVGKTMIARGQGGKIINIASTAGLVSTHPEILDSISYHASKGAVVMFTRDLAIKWAKYGINVNCIAPGTFPTRMSQAMIDLAPDKIIECTPLHRFGAEDDVKGLAVFLVSEGANYITGQTIAVDGGMTAW